tara:strand:- start:2848 stop:3990 length:1143 start_codon:yes stop_codon:yes gene_type:complete
MNLNVRKQLTEDLARRFNVEGPLGEGSAAVAQENFANMAAPGGNALQNQMGREAQGYLAAAGLTGPGGASTDWLYGTNPQPPDRDAVGMPIGGGAATGAAGQTPIRVSDPGTFFGGQQGGIGNLQGAMGMGGQVTPPTLAQTVAGQQPAAPTTGGLPAVPGAGGATGAGATATGAGGSPTGVGNSPTGVGNPAPAATGASSANTSPTIGTPAPAGGATSNSLINTGALSAPGVGLGEVQNTVANSPVLGNNPVTDQQMFQQTYNPMINMAGQTDIQNQMGGTPGRSMVGGQYGEGGLMGIAMQQQANQAALQGGTAAQQGIQANLQQQLQGQQVMAGMDASGRQQAVQQANAILGPALSGAATGFGQGLGGMTRMPQFIG